MRSTTRAAKRMASSLSEFGLELHRRLPSDADTLVSPVSLGAALTALLSGARRETARQIADVLRLPPGADRPGAGASDLLHALRPRTAVKKEWSAERRTMVRGEEDLFRLALATGLFVQERYPLHTAFCDDLDEVYDAEFSSLSFADPAAAARRINDWVAERTERRITRVVDDLDPTTRLVLANAVYLNARWALPFVPRMTRVREFRLESGETVMAPTMMSDEMRPYWIDRGLGAQAVRLRYSAVAEMIVVLPDENRRSEVEAQLSTALLDRIVRTSREVDLRLTMPTFEQRFTLDGTGLLKEMGIVEAFTDNADFSGATPDPAGLRLSHVAHRAWIRVDEQRTEAAAATVAGVALGAALGSAPKPVVLDVCRPFLFFVRDMETGATLFQGRVMDPR